MSKKDNSKIMFATGDDVGETVAKIRKGISFVPDEAAQRIKRTKRSGYSEAGELKSYLNPRGNIR